MAFRWVNYKQTYRQETDGGDLWSPKANANGARNVSDDNLSRCYPNATARSTPPAVGAIRGCIWRV